MHKALIFLCGFTALTLSGMEAKPKIEYDLNKEQDNCAFYNRIKELGFGVDPSYLYPTDLPEGWSSASSPVRGTATKRSVEFSYSFHGKVRFQIQESVGYYQNKHVAVFYEE